MKHGWLVAAVFIALLSGYAGFLHAQKEWVSAAQWLRCVSFDASYLDASRTPEERAEAVLSRMTRAEKIGQMALIEKNSLQDLSDLSRYHLGAVLSGFGAKPEPNTPEAWQDMISRFNTQTKETCLQIRSFMAWTQFTDIRELWVQRSFLTRSDWRPRTTKI